MHHVARSGGCPGAVVTKSSRHSCSVRRLSVSPPPPRAREEISLANWKALRSIALKYEYEKSSRPVRMRSETKMPVALEQRVTFIDARGLGTASALVEAQQLIHGAELSRPR